MSAINLNHFRILEIEEKVQEPCYLPPSTPSTDSFPYPVLEKVQDPCYLPPPTLSTDTFSFPYPVLEKMQDPCYLPPSTDTFSFPYPVLVNTPQNQRATGNLYQQQEAHKLLSIGGSSDRPVSFQIKENNNNNIVERSLAYQYSTRDHHVHGSSKCMDPKVLLMRKAMSPDQTTVSNPRKSMQATRDSNRRGSSSSSSISTSGVIRVCSDCNTTKTPLWRSGPQGPKSLCNACGIRQRKARRAMAPPSDQVKMEKIADGDRIVPFKKRCKFTAKKKLHLDGVAVGLCKDPSLHQVFPQDEKDAAILLMALSCGLLHG